MAMQAALLRRYEKIAASPYYRYKYEAKGGLRSDKAADWGESIKRAFLSIVNETQLSEDILRLERMCFESAKVAEELKTDDVAIVISAMFAKSTSTRDSNEDLELWDEGAKSIPQII